MDEILKSSDTDYNRYLKRQREQHEANLDGRPKCDRNGHDPLFEALSREHPEVLEEAQSKDDQRS